MESIYTKTKYEIEATKRFCLRYLKCYGKLSCLEGTKCEFLDICMDEWIKETSEKILHE